MAPQQGFPGGREVGGRVVRVGKSAEMTGLEALVAVATSEDKVVGTSRG